MFRVFISHFRLEHAFNPFEGIYNQQCGSYIGKYQVLGEPDDDVVEEFCVVEGLHIDHIFEAIVEWILIEWSSLENHVDLVLRLDSLVVLHGDDLFILIIGEDCGLFEHNNVGRCIQGRVGVDPTESVGEDPCGINGRGFLSDFRLELSHSMYCKSLKNIYII